ncbi:MAG: transcriptional repressor [Epsilonproteobacteria bacterium]|nr:transcriptional repressor [Campylobacterota bacterium]
MEKYIDMLKANDLKATFQRITILSVLDKLGHANVDEIYENVKATHPTLSLATIYKNIISMVEKGVVVEVPISGKKSKYELKKDEHIHLICINCGSVEDFPFDEKIAKDTIEVANKSHYKLKERQINLYGICPKCGD